MGGGCSGLSGDALINNTNEVPCFKIVLVGDAQVGKTSVFLRYFKNQFDYSYRPTTTVSIENVVKKLNVPEHIVASISIWDLPGREEVDLRQSYYKDVDAAIVVVDISDPESVDLAGTWRQDILNNAVVSKKRIVKTPEGPRVSVEFEKADPSQIPFLLLGNKFDIVEEKLARLNPPLTEDAETESNTPVGKDTNGEEGNEQDLLKTMDKAEQESDMSHGEKKSGEDEEGSEGNIWKYEEERVKDEKPAEVLQLEACCEQNGFVGSVAVSAKESDGGVHIAIQALVRHLLEHRLRHKALQKMEAVQVKRSKQKRQKAKKLEQDAFQSLELTKIPELDKLFFQCNSHLLLVHEANMAYQKSVRHFKQLCMDMEIVEGRKCSIEDCIEGIRLALKDETLELVVEEKDGFVELAVKGEEKEEDEKNEFMKELLQAFDSEVKVSCSVIASEFSAADETLDKMDSTIIDQCPDLIHQHIQSHGSVNAQEGRRIKDIVDLNRARIKYARNLCSERKQDVESLVRKITAAMMW
ncbi:uncharacterized protein [Apostichopus japonicus]|uniref:uncharacterized protein n=1 Tax=Stichopus japonicus TaxID=307972 RepID=UPI003AB825DB